MNKEVNISTFPEGWNEVIKSMDFLPDDKSKNEFLGGLVMVLLMELS
ncbi:MAG: hypothetical protein ACOWWH_01650 [Eubacteriaceae bacterium]